MHSSYYFDYLMIYRLLPHYILKTTSIKIGTHFNELLFLIKILPYQLLALKK